MLKRVVLASTAALAAMVVATGASAADTVKTVFVIALENHNFVQPPAVTAAGLNQIFGNSAAPFLNSLVTPGNPNAAMTSYASNYTNVPPQPAGATHPSEPNYVWSEAGRTGPLNDSNPFPGNVVNGPSLSASLQASGQTWRSYQEDIDLATVNGKLTNTPVAPGQYVVPLSSISGTSSTYVNEYNGSNQFNYAPKHNPQVFFNATNGGNDPTTANPEAQFYAPLQQLKTDLTNNTVANYNFITPDQFNDMHTALTGGFTYNGVHYTGDQAQIAQGDNFLSMIVPMIEASQAFQDDGAIVIWNDETEGDTVLGPDAGITGTEIVISPLAKGDAYTNTISYDHSSDLRTWQEVFGLDPANGTPFFGGAANANDLSDLFKAGAIPAGVPEPASWGLMIFGLGAAGAALRRRKQQLAPMAR